MTKICQSCGCKMKGILREYHPSRGDPSICENCAYNQSLRDKESVRFERAQRQELLEAAESKAKTIIISTTDNIYGKRVIGHLGIARGGTVRAKNVINDIGADIKNIIGGELVAYTRLMADAREQALHRMKIDAVMLKADAVIGVRFSTSTIAGGASEITAYGTAVTLAEGGSVE